MRINGQKITEIQYYDENLIRKLREEGMKMQRFNPNQIDRMEEALIIAATNVVFYDKLEKKGKEKAKSKTKGRKKQKSKDTVLTNPEILATVAATDYTFSKSEEQNLDRICRAVVDKMASVLFFSVWNAFNSGVISMETSDGIRYETKMCLDYGVDIFSGEEHFRKIGIQVINPKDPEHPEYFDSLRICREFVENDLVDMDGGFAIDMPYFTYRLFKEFDKARWEPFDMEEPEPIQEMMDKIYKERHKNPDND